MMRMLILGLIAFVVGLSAAAGLVLARDGGTATPLAAVEPPAAERTETEAPSPTLSLRDAPPLNGESDTLAVNDSIALAQRRAPGADGQPPSTSELRPEDAAAADVPQPAAWGAAPAEVDSAAPIPDRRLAKIFAAMQPREAARVLEQMEDGDVAVILGMLGDRQAAAVLSNLTPQRAAAISRMAIHGARTAR